MMTNHSELVFRCTHPKFFQSPNCVFVASPTFSIQPSQPNVSFCGFLWRVPELDFRLILKSLGDPPPRDLRWNSRDDDSTNTNLRLKTGWKNRMCVLITAIDMNLTERVEALN